MARIEFRTEPLWHRCWFERLSRLEQRLFLHSTGLALPQGKYLKQSTSRYGKEGERTERTERDHKNGQADREICFTTLSTRWTDIGREIRLRIFRG
jgi:hypothetical protein